MTATTSSTEITRYLDEVRALLADLPADERDELLDDLAVHLREVRAETDEPLEQALGNPADFAAELLASSGHRSASHRRGLWPPVPGLDRAQRRWERLLGSAAWRWMQVLRPELVPGWWVLRGYLGVLLLVELLSDRSGSFPVPRIGGSPLLGLVAVAGGIVASVQLGRRSADRRTPLWVWVLDALVVLSSLGVLSSLNPSPEYVYVEDAHNEPSATGALTQPDGTTITNLFAYDAEGRLLDGVLLYDQDGTPVEVAPDHGSMPYTDDGLPVSTDYRLYVNGAEVRNAYPLDQRVEEWRSGPDGSQRVVPVPVRPPAITTPRLAPEETATTSTSTTSTPITSTTSAPPEESAPDGSPAEAPPGG